MYLLVSSPMTSRDRAASDEGAGERIAATTFYPCRQRRAQDPAFAVRRFEGSQERAPNLTVGRTRRPGIVTSGWHPVGSSWGMDDLIE